MAGACNCACSAVCAYCFPPLGVYWRFGCGFQLCLNIVLTCLGYVPGVLHACCIIGCENPDNYNRSYV